MNPDTSNNKKLELRGQVKGSVKKIIERAIKAEYKVDRLQEDKGGLASEKVIKFLKFFGITYC